MRWLWAAYRMGVWRELIADDLNKNAFCERMIEIMAAINYDWIIEAKGDEGIRPVGLILAYAFPDGRIITPHVYWFPWATGRNKMEGSAVYLKEIGKRFKIFLHVDMESVPFWKRMVQYHILRQGCKVTEHYANGDDSMFFYTVGP